MTLTIQAGKYYRTRDGRKVGPIEENGKATLYVWRDQLGSCDFWRYDGRHHSQPALDFIAEWTKPMTNPPHIIQSANGRVYDLTALETPFGLLPEDVQAALKVWPHGLSIWIEGLWRNVETMRSRHDNVYRAKPAPKVTEHVLYWRAGTDVTRFIGHMDTHKITIRHTGDTLPYGTYTGPDGATITVEKAE
jgi:hypothetical protein